MVVGVERKANKVRVLDNRLEILANIYACSLPKKIYSPSLTISHKNHQAPVTHSINTSFHGLGVKPREDIHLPNCTPTHGETGRVPYRKGS